MKKIIKNFFKKLTIALYNPKLLLVYKKKRFKKGYFKIFGKKFIFSDSLSFIFMYLDIFIEESYKFISKTDEPVIIDCGSNIGLSILYFKKLYPNSIIKGFEPDKYIFEILEKNCSNFKLKNLSIYNKGVYDKNSTVGFKSDGSDGGTISNMSNDYIEVIRLKDILEKEENIDLLKIDIEGAELEVLRDCQNSFSNVNLLFIEYHSYKNKNQDLDEILNILKKAGFRYYINSLMTKNYFIEKTKNNFDLQLNIYACKNS